MSYESDECKLLIDEAIHDYLHDDTETEMTVKDWFYDLRKQATKADEYEAKNKELLEELKYLKKVNDDLVWQRDTDEEHEAKAKAWDKYKAHMESHIAGAINEEEFVSDLKSDYFESGDYYAEK